MVDGFTTELIVVAWCAGLTSALLVMRDVGGAAALALAAVRVGIPLCYFGVWFNPQWTTLDDVAYFHQGCDLWRAGFNPVVMLLDPDGWDYLLSQCQGHHILYPWWNLVAISLFGEHYYAPVFCNVVIAFWGSSLLKRTLAQLGFTHGYCVGLQVFWLLHWDAIAWGSFLNIKDVWVQTLTIAALYCLVSYFCQRRWIYLIGCLLVAQMFWWIRFYVPLVMLAATMLWMMTQWNDPRKLLLMPLGAVGFYVALPLITGASHYWTLEPLLYGALRFSLTPMPWSIQPSYTFLTFSTLMHWLMFVPALLGAWLLWRDSRISRLYWIYLACLVALYAVTEELLGTRQRFQVAFLFAWAQFHFLWFLLLPGKPMGVSLPAPSPGMSRLSWGVTRPLATFTAVEPRGAGGGVLRPT